VESPAADPWPEDLTHSAEAQYLPLQEIDYRSVVAVVSHREEDIVNSSNILEKADIEIVSS
jgi:hypothetical protein